MSVSLDAWIPLTSFRLLSHWVTHGWTGANGFHYIWRLLHRQLRLYHRDGSQPGWDEIWWWWSWWWHDNVKYGNIHNVLSVSHITNTVLTIFIIHVISLCWYTHPVEGCWNSTNLSGLLMKLELVTDTAKTKPKSVWLLGIGLQPNVEITPHLVLRETHASVACWIHGTCLGSTMVMAMESCHCSLTGRKISNCLLGETLKGLPGCQLSLD